MYSHRRACRQLHCANGDRATDLVSKSKSPNYVSATTSAHISLTRELSGKSTSRRSQLAPPSTERKTSRSQAEKSSGFGWMGGKNGRMPAGWAGKATLDSLPSLHTRATIEIRFGIHIAMRTHGRTGGGDNDIVYVSRIHRDTPQILVPQEIGRAHV